MDQHAHVIEALTISPEQKKRVFQGLDQCGAAKAAHDQSCEGLGLHIGGRRADQDTVIDSFSQSDQFFDDGFKVFFVAGFAAEDIFHLIPDGSRFRIFDKIRKMIQEIFTEKQIVHRSAPRSVKGQVAMVFASLGGKIFRREFLIGNHS